MIDPAREHEALMLRFEEARRLDGMRPSPSWVKRHGLALSVYGISASLLVWRDKTAEGCCRMCRRDREVRALTRHHLVPVSYFSRRRKLRLIRNVSANQVPLCRPCHDLIDPPSRARSKTVDPQERLQARRELRRLLAPDEITFIIQVAGEEWLDRHYPAR